METIDTKGLTAAEAPIAYDSASRITGKNQSWDTKRAPTLSEWVLLPLDYDHQVKCKRVVL